MTGPSPFKRFLAHLVLVVITIGVLYPVLWVIKMAVEPSQGFSLGINPIPSSVSLENFRDVVGSSDGEGGLFVRQLWNSVVVSLSTAFLGVVLASTAAYGISRWEFPGKNQALGAFLVTQMFPGVVMLIPIYLLLDAAGLMDSLLGLTLVYSTTSVPFSVWMLKGYFDTIPRELEEAALLDGCSRLQTYIWIVLPLARPALAVVALFSFMTAWNEFILAATLMGNPRSYTLPIVLQQYVNDYGTQWGHFAAGAVLVSIPVVVLFFALQKHFVEGLTAGSVKG